MTPTSPPSAAWLATWPLRTVARARSRTGLPALPRPTVSIGNLALGGRAKTPVVAALAHAALAAGLRPAVLSRGYGGRIGRGDPPAVVIDAGTGPTWLRPVTERAGEVGEEPAWLAATLPGVPVAVHPRRERAAAALLEQHEADLFLLDDGFQARVQRDVDVVLLDPRRDPPFARRSAVREGAEALARAHLLGLLTPAPEPIADAVRITRRAGPLLDLQTGAPTRTADVGPVTIVAGVGDPASVARLAVESGLQVAGMLEPGDHRAPGAVLRRRLSRSRGPFLVTEKDAVGWASRRPPGANTLVLTLRLDGIEELWERVQAVLAIDGL